MSDRRLTALLGGAAFLAGAGWADSVVIQGIGQRAGQTLTIPTTEARP